ncbi:MAG: zinc-binding dehydrogenase [Candidatus Eisenbacteria bacterium]|nr:zinc-binding dehydrogenase [Candidatus Eisenbacteria bacterium]
MIMMRAWSYESFGMDNLRLAGRRSPRPGPGEILLAPRALSLNYRDLLLIKGIYNPRLKLPATPVGDGAGIVTDVGEGVVGLSPGDEVVTHAVTGWIDGDCRPGLHLQDPVASAGRGLAAEQAAWPAEALLPIPDGWSFADAASLPVAAVTAWSALVTEGRLRAGQTVLTLGTGGVSIFAAQIAKALGARVIVTSSQDDKLARARELGADFTINYRRDPDWDRRVLEFTNGHGVHITVETGGAGTLVRSLNATRSGGTVALLGTLTGLRREIDMQPLVVKRLRLTGIYVGSRKEFEALCRFLAEHPLRPAIDRRFAFGELSDALRYLESARHVGKVVIEM